MFIPTRGIPLKYIITGIRLFFLALFLFFIATGHMMLWLALFAVSLLLSLLFGRLYCGYACPMNTLMIPAAWLSKKLRLQSASTPKWLKAGYFPWFAFIISVAAMLLSKQFLHVNLPILPFWLVVAVLFTLRYRPAVFHNLVCPFGILQKTTGRFAFLSKRVKDDTCIGCKLCENACPSGAITVNPENRKATVNTALCHQCTECQAVCNKNAIMYRRRP
jgi:polyferredoxin